MGQKDEENPVSEDEAEAEKKKLNPPEEKFRRIRRIHVRARHREVIAGQDDPLIKSNHLKYLLIGFNGSVAVLGIALLAVSMWIRGDPELWEYESNLDVDKFQTACAMLIVASLILLVVGFLGCTDAILDQKWTFIFYITWFGLISLVIELAALVIMWYAVHSSTISSELEKQIRKQIEERSHDDSSRYFMDFIQEHLHCCGSTSVLDYATMSAPNSCLDPRSGDVFDNGCASKMLTYLRSKAVIVGAKVLPILFLQLLALVASGCLLQRLKSSSSYFI